MKVKNNYLFEITKQMRWKNGLILIVEYDNQKVGSVSEFISKNSVKLVDIDKIGEKQNSEKTSQERLKDWLEATIKIVGYDNMACYEIVKNSKNIFIVNVSDDIKIPEDMQLSEKYQEIFDDEYEKRKNDGKYDDATLKKELLKINAMCNIYEYVSMSLDVFLRGNIPTIYAFHIRDNLHNIYN